MDLENIKKMTIRQMFMPMIILVFAIMATFNHVINKDTHEIDVISSAFIKRYNQTATVYFENETLTYEFISKSIEDNDNAFYKFKICEDGKDIIIKVPINHTIIKQYDEVE